MSSPEFERYKAVYPKAVEAGLAAAAEVYAIDVKERLSRGYTSGAFVQGVDAASVRIAKQPDENGDSVTRVGSDQIRTFWWEMGHINHYTKRHERVEHWRNALNESGQAMTEAYQEAFNAVMAAELG